MLALLPLAVMAGSTAIGALTGNAKKGFQFGLDFLKPGATAALGYLTGGSALGGGGAAAAGGAEAATEVGMGKKLLGDFLGSAASSFGSSVGQSTFESVHGGDIYSAFEVPQKRAPREVRLSAPPPMMYGPDQSPLASSPIVRAYFERV